MTTAGEVLSHHSPTPVSICTPMAGTTAEDVKVLGITLSAFVIRVPIALLLKRVKYEFVEVLITESERDHGKIQPGVQEDPHATPSWKTYLRVSHHRPIR
ncbi:hypothetical protein ZIOFF_010282 [Zingiber officinale]|uniref:Uncharacterized protein n=1 Tax=Zingiber officinale TaxID=94328 RepID=A0A8J5HIZ4_ZINOF|nr:hypothetical protein ZIOFF_010282 [Zingiber officinale]